MPRYRCAGCDRIRNLAYTRPDLVLRYESERCKNCGSYTLKVIEEGDFDGFCRAFFKRPNKGWRKMRRNAIRMKQKGIVSISINLGLYNGKESKNTFNADDRTFGCNVGIVPINWWEIERNITNRERRLNNRSNYRLPRSYFRSFEAAAG